jgi:2-C-methyl-D-erythritol 4-phosphate cytidylyltransferase
MRGADKLWADLGGEPVLARTLRAFEATPGVARVAVATSEAAVARVEALCRSEGFAKVSAVCAGGASRQGSVLLGLRALGACDVVAVHDGARPLVTPEVIERGLALAGEGGSALCAVRAKSTHKLADPNLRVVSTPPRDSLWEAQTPQAFRYDELLAAHELAAGRREEYTDDAALMEAVGHVVQIYEGSYRNLKVTTPEDLLIARALLPVPG